MRTQGWVWIEAEGARRPVEGSALWPGGVYTVAWDTSGGGREDIVFEHHPGHHERLLPADLRLSPGGPVSVEGGFFVGIADQLREIMDDIWRGRLCPELFYPETFAPCFSGLDGRGPSLVLTVGWFGAEPDDPRYEAHVGRYVSDRRSVRVLLDSNDRRFEALNRQVLRHEMAHFALHSAFPFAHHRETVPGAAGQPRFRFWDWLAGRFEDLSWSDRTSLVGSARVQRLSRLLRQLAEGSTPSRGGKDAERLLGFALFDRVEAEIGRDRMVTAHGVLTDAYRAYNQLALDDGGVEVVARLNALFGLDGLFPEDLRFFGATAADGSLDEKLHRMSVLFFLSRCAGPDGDFVDRLRQARDVRLLPEGEPGCRAVCLPTRYSRDWRARLPGDGAGPSRLVGLLHQLRTLVGDGLASPGDFERFIDPMQKAWSSHAPDTDATELWGRFLLWWCSMEQGRGGLGEQHQRTEGSTRGRPRFIGVQMGGPEGRDRATPEVWATAARKVSAMVGPGLAPEWDSVDSLDDVSRLLHADATARERRDPVTLVLGEGFAWGDAQVVGTLSRLVREYWIESIVDHQPLEAHPAHPGDDGLLRPAVGWWSPETISALRVGLLDEPWCDVRGRVLSWTHPPFLEWIQDNKVFGEVYFPEGDRFSNPRIVQASHPMMRLLQAVRFHRELLV